MFRHRARNSLLPADYGKVRLGWVRLVQASVIQSLSPDTSRSADLQPLCDIDTAVQSYNSCLFVVSTARYNCFPPHDVRVRASVSRRRTKWSSGNFYSFSECRLVESRHCCGHASDAGDPPRA